MSYDGSDERLAGLAEALATVPPSKNRALIEMFEKLQGDLQENVLDRVTRYSNANAAVMRSLLHFLSPS